MKKTEQKVLKFIDEQKLIQKGNNILVALSGGPDSVFLLHFLVKYKQKFGIKIAAIHLNHMIRGKAADEDEAFCAKLCLYLSIELFAVRKNVKQFASKNKISVEEAGRIIRYREFDKVCRQIGYDRIATAHNCNDNAETVLLNLAKGAGIKGMSGIPVKRGKIIRPILNVTKDEILTYLKERKILYRTDLSNLSNDYTRNFLRHEIIPLIKRNINPNLENVLLNSSEIFRDSAEYFERITNDIRDSLFSATKNELRISLPELNKYDKTISAYALKSLIERNFSVQTEFNDIKNIISLKGKQTGRRVELSNKFTAVREREEIIIYRGIKVPIELSVRLKEGDNVEIAGKKLKIKKYEGTVSGFSGSRSKEFISADNIKGDFQLRRWKTGEKFFPIGFIGSKKISDFLNEQKIPSSQKKEQLVLTNDNKVVWVVGLRLDDRFKITNQTKKVLELCLK